MTTWSSQSVAMRSFLDKRSLPQNWDLEHIESRPSLSAELAQVENDQAAISNSKAKTIEIGQDIGELTNERKDRRQTSVHSQDSGWTLNTELDRVSSSLASWDEDDFEKETSRRVESLLQELDAALYEGAALSNKHLQQECAEWAATFPYLRVIGKQVVVPKREKGYSYHASSNQSTRKIRPPGSSTPKELSLVGRRMKPTAIRQYDDDEPKSRSIIEELLVQDGIYEELLAVDRSAEEAEYNTRDLTATSSTTDQRVSDDLLKSDIVDALFESVWPEVEKSLNERRNSAISNDLLTLADKPHPPSTIRESHSPLSNRSRIHAPTVAKKRVPSTAMAAYGSHLHENRAKMASSMSRTAPAFSRAKPPSAGKRDNAVNTVLRSSRFTKLPPIDNMSAPHLPNVPALKSQHSRANDHMSKINEYPIDDDDDETLELARKINTMPPLADTKVVKQQAAISDAATMLNRNMQSLKIGKRQAPIETKTYKARNPATESRRAKTVGVGGGQQQQNSLVIQGYQQRAFSK